MSGDDRPQPQLIAHSPLPQRGWLAPGRVRGARGYWLALLTIAAAFWLRLLLGGAADEPLLELFLVPVVICGYLSGPGPCLLALGLSGLLGPYFVLPPLQSFAIEAGSDRFEWLLLLLVGSLVCVLSQGLHRAWRDSESGRRLYAVTLASIGDAVITTDIAGRVTLLNGEAERLTGWTPSEAVGRPLSHVCRLLDPATRAPVADPAARAPGAAAGAGLLLVARDGREIPIDDSAAPIRTPAGAVIGAVLSFRDRTAQQRAEDALRQSEARLAGIVGSAMDGIISVDDSHRIVLFNRAAEQIFGCPAAEAVGRPLDRFLPAQVRELHAANVRDFAGSGGTRQPLGVPSALTARRADGGEFPIEATISRAVVAGRNENTLMIRDITARKQAEQQLRYQADLLEQVSDAIISTDAAFTIKSWNRAAEELYGWEAEEAIGRWMGDVVPTIYLSDKEGDAQTALLRDGRWQGEVLHQHRDGTQRTILSSVSLLKNADGAFAGAVGVNRDITARKQTERELRQLTARLQVLADASHAFAEAGTDYRTLLDQVARTTTAVLGEGCVISLLSDDATRLQFVGIYDVDPQQHALQASLLRGTTLSVNDRSFSTRVVGSGKPLLLPIVDLERARADTRPEFWRLMSRAGVHALLGVPMRVQGQAIGAIIIHRHRPEQPPFDADDLTLAQDLADRAALAIANARLRLQIEQHAHALEQRVNERTAELADANKELEAFSYSVSHDLRAPLRAIDGFSRIIQDEYAGALPAEAQEFFQLVRSNAQQMGHLVDDLLAFAHLSRQPLSRRPVDHEQLVRRCLEELEGEARGRQLRVEVGPLPISEGDPALLKQVWFNLIANALKYTRRRAHASIAIGSVGEGPEPVYFIKDNGVGFDMRYSDKLFGVFQRMHRAEEYEGTGVGLAIVQRIVHRHGGRVWAEAKVDQGASFFFSLGGTHQ